MAGYTSNCMIKDVKIPPTIGAAIRFITSAPASHGADHPTHTAIDILYPNSHNNPKAPINEKETAKKTINVLINDRVLIYKRKKMIKTMRETRINSRWGDAAGARDLF
jgi:hypothetical protein